MAVTHKPFRNRMLLTTAATALMVSVPATAHAQLVRQADLSSAVDSVGNTNQLTVTDTNATTTDIEVEAAVVVAEWNDFDIGMGDTVNVTIDGGLGIAEATLFNRVIGGDPSTINGTLNANGINFWLINQNGIMFGANTQVNARSFFASTLDIANQDIFDFYEGTNLFGNGTDTLSFVDPTPLAAEGITSAAGASFSLVGDGSLMFVGQQLNLTGTFDADMGRAAFVSATDIDVNFTPGSPLTYTVNAGTTIAAAQTVGGTVEGASTEFAMITATGVMNAILRVDANVTATTAVATDTGVVLLAQGQGAEKPNTQLNGTVTSTGVIDINGEGDLLIQQAMSGAAIDIDHDGALNSPAGLTATSGNVEVNAASIASGPVNATSGDVTLIAAGDVGTSSITAGGAIDVESSAGGALGLGALSSGTNINVDTSGAVTAGTVTAGDALAVGATTPAASIQFLGNVTADSIDLNTDVLGSLTAINLTAGAGYIDIDGGSVSANALLATGDVAINAAGPVALASATADSENDMMGDVVIVSTGGGSAPPDIAITGIAQGASVSLTSSGAVALPLARSTVGSITIDAVAINSAGSLTLDSASAITLMGAASANSINLDAMDAISTEGLTATAGIAIDTPATVETGTISAGAVLTIGTAATPTSIQLNGNAMATSMDINTTSMGSLSAVNLTATAGDIDIDGGAVSANALEATGNVLIDAAGNVSLASATADSDGNMLGNVAITTTGAMVPAPDISVSGAATGENVTLTSVDDISASIVSADGAATLAAGGNVTTSAVTAGTTIDADSTGGGTLMLGNLNAGTTINLDTTGSVRAGTVTAGGALTVGSAMATTPSAIRFSGNAMATSIDLNTQPLGNINAVNLTATAGDVDIDGGSVTANALAATGNVTIAADDDVRLASATADSDANMTGDVTVTTTGAGVISFSGSAAGENVALSSAEGISAVFVTANGGAATLNAAGAVTTSGITAGTTIDVDSTASGNLNLGNLSANAGITLDTDGTLRAGTVNADSDSNNVGALVIGSTSTPSSVRFTGNVAAASIDIEADNDGSVIARDQAMPANGTNLTATAGAVEIVAGSITAGVASATGGNVELTAMGAGASSGNVSTSSITSDAMIDVQSDGGGNLALGDLSAQTGIELDTTGDVRTGAINGNAGALAIGASAEPGSIRFTGDVMAATIDINSTGAVIGRTLSSPANATNLMATTGAVDIDSASVNVGNVSGSTTVTVLTTGALVTEDVTAGAGNVSLTGGSISSADIVANSGSALLSATGSVMTMAITATGGGLIDVTSTNGDEIEVGDLLAENGVTLTTTGDLTTGAINSDTDGNNVGALQTGAAPGPNSVTFGGAVSAPDVNVVAVNAIDAQDITATNGGITLDGASISAANLEAMNGNVMLEATGAISTLSALATGNIAANSTGGGDLDLGDLTAASGVMLDTTGDLKAGTVNADSNNDLSGDLDIGSMAVPATATLTGNATAANINIQSGSLDGQNLTATGDVTVDGSGAVVLGAVTADSDSNGSGAVAIGSMDSPASISLADGAKGTAISLVAGAGGVAVGTNAMPAGLTATAGDVVVTAAGAGSSVDIEITSDILATGGDVTLTADNDVAATNITATQVGMSGGAIAVQSVQAGELTLGNLTADSGVTLDANEDITALSIIGDDDGDGSGSVVVGSTVNPSRFVVGTGDPDTIDFAGNGNPTTFVGGTISGAEVSVNSQGLVAVGDVTASNGAVTLASGRDVFVGNVMTDDLIITATDTVLLDGTVTANGDGELEGNSLFLGNSINVVNGTLTIRSNGEDVALGDAQTGNFRLSDADLDSIVADRLVIDAGSNRIGISNVSFDADAGSSEVVLATSGSGDSLIRITGDVSGDGVGRVFRFGGDAAGTPNVLSNRIIADIANARIDLGDAGLDLRGLNIVFGDQALLRRLRNDRQGGAEAEILLSAESVAVILVGGGQSSDNELFNPSDDLVAALGNDPVYLRAGSLSVTYDESALFQNTIPLAEGQTDFAGVVLGDVGGTGSLSLNPINDTNAFALFGQINELQGDAVALAPEPILSINGQTSVFGSRINGCIIRSGADCITTIVDSTIISVPRDAVSLLTADPDVFLPFDPLVGTNNEGLFSGATAVRNDEECERDENGICI